MRHYDCRDLSDLVLIGKGAFGQVYEAFDHTEGTNVAIKVIKGQNKREHFRRELHRMQDLDHPNVINLLGVLLSGKERGHERGCFCPQNDTSWLIMEHHPHGNLLDYIDTFGSSGGSIPANEMIQIAHGVALGMKYLHRTREVVVHGDLAARNILINEDLQPVISDLGLCDSNYDDLYYSDSEVASRRGCPIRWMPPENLPDGGCPDGRLTRKGDVWAFGVVLYELWSRGKTPFDGWDNQTVIRQVKSGSTVLTAHPRFNARQWVKTLMAQCFAFNKEDRPNFRFISEDIEENAPNLFE